MCISIPISYFITSVDLCIFIPMCVFLYEHFNIYFITPVDLCMFYFIPTCVFLHVHFNINLITLVDFNVNNSAQQIV